jgi:hypothetical protein
VPAVAVAPVALTAVAVGPLDAVTTTAVGPLAAIAVGPFGATLGAVGPNTVRDRALVARTLVARPLRTVALGPLFA